MKFTKAFDKVISRDHIAFSKERHDILAGAPSSERSFMRRLRIWLSGLLRGDMFPFWGWSYILPILPISPSQVDGFTLRWKDDSSSPPDVLYINGKLCQPDWLRGEEQTAFIHATTWQQHENVLAAKAPMDWKRLSIQPIFSTASVNASELQESVIDKLPSQNDSSDDLPASIQRALVFIRNSINADPFSEFSGLCYGCYDLTNEGFRLSSWVWTNGIVISALLEALSGDDSVTLATKIGKAALRFQVKTGKHAGALMVRRDPVTDVPQGFAEWLAPNDAALFAGYGLLPLYDATRDSQFWEASVGVANWILREGMKDGRLRVGFRLEQNRWVDSWLYIDAGFTPVLFARLYSMDQKSVWKQACEWIMDDLLARLYAGNGELYSAWLWPGRVRQSHFARGYAWFLDGLLHAYRCTGRSEYLDVAKACADTLLSHQHSSGAWRYLLNRSETGFCNKGTPAIAWQLLQLYRHTDDERLIRSARRALDWCAANQYLGDDTNAWGGIVSWNTEGAIAGAKNIMTAFPYASGFQVLAELLWRNLNA